MYTKLLTTKRPIVANVLVEVYGIDRTEGSIVGNIVCSWSEKGHDYDDDSAGKDTVAPHGVGLAASGSINYQGSSARGFVVENKGEGVALPWAELGDFPSEL